MSSSSTLTPASHMLIALAKGERALPDSYGVKALQNATRDLMRQLEPPYSPAEIQMLGTQDELSALVAELITYEHERWCSTKQICQRTIEMQLEFLTILAKLHLNSGERRALGEQFVQKHFEFFIGWELLCVTDVTYQLTDKKPWWKPGPFPSVHAEYRALSQKPSSSTQLKRAGFVQISQEDFIERVRIPMLRFLLFDSPNCLLPAALTIALYTASRDERQDLPTLVGLLRSQLALSVSKQLDYQGATIPMKPLYSLPREARNLSHFFISHEDDLHVDDDRQLAHPKSNTRARAKHIRSTKEGGGQQLLFFDQDLVNKRSGEQNAYISIELDGKYEDTLSALFAAIEQLDIDRNLLEHLPRVTAGIFAAAHRDRKMDFSWPGTIWDTESGARLCRICGFDPRNHKHRQLMQNMRTLLERIILHREVRTTQGGTKTTVNWRGPILEARKGQIDIRVEHREGMSGRHTYHSWSIAKELWNMVISEDEGGTPAFMVIDQRAFQLSTKSSRPFNIYWTLINRAYMGMYSKVPEDRVQPDGSFSPKLETLYVWSGMNGDQRPYRLKELFREAFDLMKEHGLITSWKCEALLQKSRVSVDEIKASRIHVVFDEEQITKLPRALSAGASHLEDLTD